MSIVLNILTPIKSYVAYDGRARRNGRIVNEYVKKADMVNDFVCVGFTGILELASDVLRILRNNVVGIEEMRSNTVAVAVQTILKLPNAPKFSGVFLITGFNDAGQMALYTIDSQLSIQGFVASKSDYRLIQLGGDNCPISFADFCASNAHGQGEKAIMDEFIKYAALYDDSVNSNVKFITIS